MLSELKKQNTEFVKEYGKTWQDFIDVSFISTLFSTLLLTSLLILFIANKNYSQSENYLSELITLEYIKTLYSNIKIDSKNSLVDDANNYSNININTSPELDLDNKTNLQSSAGNAPLTNSPSNVNELNLNNVVLPEALVAVKNKNNIESYVRPIQQSNNNEIDFSDSNPLDPWATPIRRQGNISIEPIEKIVRGSQIIRGWRNPNEITLAIQKKETMIEYCFKREAKFFSDMQGYILVRFIILHTGVVDPASVKILGSSIFNKQIESCIKKRLKWWRGFEELDASMGSVAVVQKFIFD